MKYGMDELFHKWKVQGYVSYSDFRRSLPDSIVDLDQIDEIESMIKDIGVDIRMIKAKVVPINAYLIS